MPPSGSQTDWVRQVLGVSFGQGTTKGRAPLGPLAADLTAARDSLVSARDKMTDALSKADLQIRKLQAVLAVYPDTQLKEIAGSPDLGINALTGNYRVRVLAALQDIQAAPPEKLHAVLQKARTLVAGFSDHIQTSDRLEACEQNWLQVPVKVRDLISPALAELSRSIDKFAA
jgi:hypothetical protein